MKAEDIAQEMVDNLNSKFLDNNPEWEGRNPTVEALNKYAKYHVIQALKRASDEAQITRETPWDSVEYAKEFEIFTHSPVSGNTLNRLTVDKSSILLCYSDKDIEGE